MARRTIGARERRRLAPEWIAGAHRLAPKPARRKGSESAAAASV
jgi:hypothetical protein